MSRTAMDLLREVRANTAKLDACPRHLLRPVPPHSSHGRLELLCDHCGGRLRSMEAGQYVRGYVAAGGNAEDVWPGWN